MATDQRYMVGLTAALQAVKDQGSDISTQTFTDLCDQMLTVFDHLGMVMGFAKNELSVKNASLKSVADTCPTLNSIVAHDKALNRVTVKNSASRNLHRLMCSITFVRLILNNLLQSPTTTLKDAVYQAYEGSLGPYHTYLVRTAVWAGLVALPTRDSFMSSIGETNETARAQGVQIMQQAMDVVTQLEKLYDAPMPVSDVTWLYST